LEIVIGEINMLICLANDVLDRKLIELGRFESHHEVFEPIKIFQFIVKMFASQSSI